MSPFTLALYDSYSVDDHTTFICYRPLLQNADKRYRQRARWPGAYCTRRHPIYTGTTDQQIQAFVGDSSLIFSRKTGDTHDDENHDKEGEKIYDGGEKLDPKIDHPTGDKLQIDVEFGVCTTHFEGKELNTFEETRVALERWTVSRIRSQGQKQVRTQDDRWF